MSPKTATFIGHSDCFEISADLVSAQIERLVNEGYTRFLCGGMGGFDWLCARCVHDLKATYPALRLELVIPYLTATVQHRDWFDTILYPEGFERYYFKKAIIKRNEYLVEQATAAVCYITHNWGGAARTYALARKKGLDIILVSKM